MISKHDDSGLGRDPSRRELSRRELSRREFVGDVAKGAAALGAAAPLSAFASASGLPQRALGRTGAEVSVLCLGGWHIGFAASQDEAAAIRVMHAAIDEGVTFFDNSWDYHDGGSENVMGKALASEGRRHKVFLMTKGCERDYAGAMRCIDESLKRLRTDYLDLWQFHEIIYENDPDWVFEQGGIRAAVEAKEAGKIRHIGFTGHRDPRVHKRMLDKPFDWETVQLPINMMDAQFRSFRQEIVPICVERGAGVIGMKSLGRRRHSVARRRGRGRVHPLCAQPAGLVAGGRHHVDGRAAAERGDGARLHADAGGGTARAPGQHPRRGRRRTLRALQDHPAHGRAVPCEAARL